MPATRQKPWEGQGMEGWVARWYTRTRQFDMQDFCRRAQAVAGRLRNGSDVLEVAPGPGFFAIELARAGNFKITGLDASRTLVEISNENARTAAVKVGFQLGNASAMPFADESFDYIYCSAAFKNFSEPVKALDEMHRVLRPRGVAEIEDLRKDVSVREIDDYVRRSGRRRFDAWMTRLAFRTLLIKRAYTQEDLRRMAGDSRFRTCEIKLESIGVDVLLNKPALVAAQQI